MRVVFPYRGSEALGVEALMAWLDSKGHDTRLVFDPAVFSGARGRDIPFLSRMFDVGVDKIVDRILELEPDVLAVSCVTGTYAWALDVARRVRSRKRIPTVFGGIHPTAAPDAVIAEDAVDAIVLGEGEHALAELVASVSDGRFGRTDVANSWIKADGGVVKNPQRGLIHDMDALPFAKKSAYYEKAPTMARNFLFMTSRGCPLACTYCCNSLYRRLYPDEKNHVRRYSPSRAVAEIEAGIVPGATQFVEFWDDVFTKDKDWLAEFGPLYKSRIGLPFQCYAHPHFMDDERAALLKDAGCSQVKMGVQSLESATLKEVLKRPGGADRVESAIAALKSCGIRVSVEHLLDVPGEGIEAQERAAKFYNRCRPDKIASFWLVYYPGAEIGKLAVERGIMSEEDLREIESGSGKFTYTFMFPGGQLAERRKPLKAIQILFDILPMLPPSVVDKLIDSGLYRRLPYSGILHQLLMLINAVRINEREDLQALRYVAGPKNIP